MGGDGRRKTIHDLLREAQARLERLEPLEAAAAAERGALLVDIRRPTSAGETA